MMLGVAIWELPRKGVPVGLAIPLAHAGEDAGGGRHVQPHRKRLSSKETLHPDHTVCSCDLKDRHGGTAFAVVT